MTKRTSAKSRPAPTTPAPTTLTRADAAQLFDQIQRLTSLVQGLGDGTIVVKDEDRGRVKARDLHRAVKDLNASTDLARLATSPDTHDRALLRALQTVPEPKRQRKERHMPARTVYTLKPVKTESQLAAIQRQTPAAKSILVYLAAHERATVSDLAVQLDLRKKTVWNILSILQREHIVTVEPSSR